MKKFIIIDHSLQDLQGHHYECSVSVAEAVQRLNYEAIIIANKNFSPHFVPKNIKIVSEFEIDWFNNSTKKLNNFQKKIKKLTEFLSNFNLDDVIGEYKNKINYKLFKLKVTKPKIKILLEKIEGSLFRFNQWIKQDIKLIKYIPLSHSFFGICKTLFGVFQLGIKAIHKINQKLWFKFFNFNVKTFQESLENIINILNITSEDHIFIHTLGVEQLEELLYLLQKQPLEKNPQYHIMLRRDIDDYLVKNAQGIGIKNCLTEFYQYKLFPNKVKFYTDTSQLVDRYNSLSPIQFIEIPVPFRQEKLVQNKTVKLENKCLHLVYLGDARIEKGYLYLPQIVGDLWEDYLLTKTLKITIQSNFNIASGEKDILASRLTLEQYPETMVKIIKNAMTTEEYYQLLMSADLLVIPYDNNSYRYRTSGVLTESLAAGKPVIVPANSWLASQIDETRGVIYNHPNDISKGIIKLINNIKEYQKNAELFSLHWCKKHSPDNLVNCLLSPINIQDNITQKNRQKVSESCLYHKPHFLFVINIDRILNLDINGQIILSHLQYLSECNYLISIITYCLKSPLNHNNNDHQFAKLENILDNYNIKKTWLLQLDDTPQFIPSLDQEKYFHNYYNNEPTFTREIIDINSLLIPHDLKNHLQQQKIDNILLDSISSQILVNNLGLSSISIVCQVSQLQSYQYGIENNQDIDLKELDTEYNLFSQINVIITNYKYLAEKIINKFPSLITYTLPCFSPLLSTQKSLNNTKITDFLWGNNKSQYYQIINDSLNLDRIINNLSKTSQKIAILYPWGDILERKAGASQRVGLLIDYLQEKDNNIWLFTTGEEKDLFLNNVRYTFYDQKFNHLDLVKQVYRSSYESLMNINKGNQLLRENSNLIPEDWRLNMYYQFYGDDNFTNWIEKIINWADIVILEYPFWGKIVSKICQEKNVKLIITAHDILCKQVSLNTPLYQTLLAEEISNLKKADHVVCVSQEDQKFLQQWGINSQQIANPVNLNLGQKNNVINNQEKWFNIYPWLRDNYCLFVGSGHFPNVEAVREIKKIASIYQEKKYNPRCRFVVIGNCHKSENEDNFISLGKVELELLSLLYQNAKLILAPMLSGTGSSLKIPEAMSFGKVVLGTKIAFRGYDIQNKIHGIIEDNLALYPDTIEQLLTNNDELIFIGNNAQNLANNYNYKFLYEGYLKLVESRDSNCI
ncbi:glycosyltransferase [Geminocystis sp. NIES-3709]|uniref:glycosyltransferase n=1 Tax=Geminocystis sp. NIES-3709 TaxID=1617448 RepID=UPI0005FCD61A|nr:glycosyltransferase [Geminocystis sp. NIES-3709]BAQ66007.1 hypothetical protein GM3709_2772 [Geminocystis sp. NIES-3709]